MSSSRNFFRRRAYKERAQPESRKKFGLLEKHKDYVVRARAFHKKEEAIRKLKLKASLRNPDEFYFKMVNTKMVDGVHKPKRKANKYTQEEHLPKKTQDIGYALQPLQREKKKDEEFTAGLQSLINKRSSNHLYFAEDREEAREIQARLIKDQEAITQEDLQRKLASFYKEAEATKKIINDLLKQVNTGYMSASKELKEVGRKRKLCDDEIWHTERKRKPRYTERKR